MIDTSAAQYVSPPKAADILDCSPEKIIGFIKRGELRAVDLSNHPGMGKPRYRIDKDDLDAFLKTREVVPRQQTRRRVAKSRHVIEFFK